MRRKFLFSYALPPMLAPRSIQISHIIPYLPKPLYGISASVTGKKDSLLLNKISGNMEEMIYVSEPNFFLKILRGIEKKVPSLLPYPDPHIYWSIKASRTLIERYKIGSEDILATFGAPMSDHVAGLSLKMKTGVRWIAHFSDPWSDNPYHHSSKKKRNLYWEKKVINYADRLIFTSEETVDLVMSKYPSSYLKKTFVLPNCFDPNSYGDNTVEFHKGKKKIVRYIGDFYGIRSPLSFLKALRQLKNRDSAFLDQVSIEFIGNIGRSIREEMKQFSDLSEYIQVLPSVGYQEALKKMIESDMLLVIDAPLDQSIFLPSKLVEYLGSGRPIFGLTPPGTSQKLIESIGGYVVGYDDEENICSVLQRALRELIEGKATLSADYPEIRAHYLAETTGRAFSDIIEGLL